MYLLSIILWLPLLGAVAVACLPEQRLDWIRWVARLCSAVVLLLATVLPLGFDTEDFSQLAEFLPWNPGLGSAYALGVDGLSLPMVLLTTLLSFVAVLVSSKIKHAPKSYHAWLLVLETGMLGVFLAQDWTLFYLFWELTLIPLFLLIDRWGGARRQRASLTFVIYTMSGAIFLLISLLLLYQHGGSHSSTMTAMAAAAATLSAEQQFWIFLGFLLGFGVKMPIFPLHGWLPLAHVEAPSPISILLSGVLLKMGAYGLLRASAMLPGAAISLQPWLAGLAFAGIIYGGLLAWRQTDLKAMIAYSSISHMGVVLLGIAAFNEAGLLGAEMQMVAHGLVAGLLFLLIGLLYERTHTREMADYSSLVQTTPRFALFTSLAFLAGVGLPGTAGFIAELHTLLGSFQRWGWFTLLFSAGVLISAAYALRAVSRLFTGPVRPQMTGIPDLTAHELGAAALLAVFLVGYGLYPAPLSRVAQAASGELSGLLGATAYSPQTAGQTVSGRANGTVVGDRQH